MPRGDRTGPAGMGPMTCLGGGHCANTGRTGFTGASGSGLFGRGWGAGSGPGSGGRGFCRWFFGAGLPVWRCFAGWRTFEGSDPAVEKRSLQDQLERIKKRLQEMEAGEASG
jgi:hypothetical protein